jgi:hypothetical protein
LEKTSPSCFDMRLLQDDSTSIISSEKRRRKHSVISSPWLWIYFFSVISDTRIYLVLALILKTRINRHYLYIYIHIYLFIYTDSALPSQKTQLVFIRKTNRWLLNR